MKKDREVVFDAIKAIAILMVIVFHATMNYSLKIFSILWLEQAVPLFLCITAYLTFRKFDTQTGTASLARRSIWQIFKYIFIPFLIFESAIVIYSVSIGTFSFRAFVLGAGFGPGSYYPWLYLQFWLLLPYGYKIIVKTKANILLATIIAIIPEVAFSILHSLGVSQGVLDPIWRVFVGRYLFVMYIAYSLLKKELTLKRCFVPVVLGLAFIIISRYELIDLSSFFYSTVSFAWKGVHWPMYFYSGMLFMLLYRYLSKKDKAKITVLKWIGRNSWIVFLSQMAFFYVFPSVFLKTGSIFSDVGVYILSAVALSLLITFVYTKVSTSLAKFAISMTNKFS